MQQVRDGRDLQKQLHQKHLRQHTAEIALELLDGEEGDHLKKLNQTDLSKAVYRILRAQDPCVTVALARPLAGAIIDRPRRPPQAAE